MSSFGLERLFASRSLALVGGSTRPSSLGAKVLQNLLSGFAGEIAVVNPKYLAIDGKNAYRDLAVATVRSRPDGNHRAGAVHP